MIDSPTGFPVIVHDQISEGESLAVFCGLALRIEDAYGGSKRYTGKISVIRVLHQYGQNERMEIHHRVDHYSKRDSACYWVYPDEIKTMLNDFKYTWDPKEKQEAIMDIMQYLGLKQKE